jgi:hypothetical protein
MLTIGIKVGITTGKFTIEAHMGNSEIPALEVPQRVNSCL